MHYSYLKKRKKKKKTSADPGLINVVVKRDPLELGKTRVRTQTVKHVNGIYSPNQGQFQSIHGLSSTH